MSKPTGTSKKIASATRRIPAPEPVASPDTFLTQTSESKQAWSAKEYKTEAGRRLIELEAFGWSRAYVRQVLGLDKDYFDRVLAEIDQPGREFQRPQLNARVAAAVIGLARGITSPPSSTCVDPHYITAVVRDFDSLKSGDRHTLLSAPPPLETYFPQILLAALNAAARGARLSYYVPSNELIQWYLAQLFPATAREQDGRIEGQSLADANHATRVFGWLRDLDNALRAFHSGFLRTAQLLDAARAATDEQETYIAALRTIDFYEVSALPIQLDEKIVWISRHPVASQVEDECGDVQCQRVYREVLLPPVVPKGSNAYVLDAARFYEGQRWARMGSPSECHTLPAFLRCFRRPIDIFSDASMGGRGVGDASEQAVAGHGRSGSAEVLRNSHVSADA